jgi:hypothetical protein
MPLPRRIALLAGALGVACLTSFPPMFAQTQAPSQGQARPKVDAKPQARPQPKPAAAVPSMKEIRALFEAGKYKETLQGLNRVLALKGDAAAPYDRHELLRLKGETHLKLRDAKSAAAAFALAVKEAPDEKSAAVDRATETVVKRSKNLAVTPRPTKARPKPEPIDVSDPEKREAAFEALLEEAKEAAAPKLKAAKGAKTLPPIVEAIESIRDLRALELAATGEDAQVQAMVTELSEQAHELMSDATQDMTELVDDIERAANDYVEIAMPVRVPGSNRVTMERSHKKRGLNERDTKDLRRVLADCEKLLPLAKGLAEYLGDSGKQFEAVAEDAQAVGKKAHELLKTDFSERTVRRVGREPAIRRPS